MADALFLHDHPGWTWQALRDAPAAVIEYLLMLDAAIADQAKR